MSDKHIDLETEVVYGQEESDFVFTDYLDSNFELSPHIAHLRNHEEKSKKLAALDARRAVEDVLEMRRYRQLHKDFYDY